jgi:hypothetical protein
VDLVLIRVPLAHQLFVTPLPSTTSIRHLNTNTNPTTKLYPRKQLFSEESYSFELGRCRSQAYRRAL